MKNIISAEELNDLLGNPDLIILNASQPENKNESNRGLYDLQIPRAKLFDLKKDFSEKSHPMPNMLQKAADFQAECRKLGIKNSSKIVVYDNVGIYTSPRVWWMFKTMGHDNVCVLAGGMPNWLKNDFPVEKFQTNKSELGDFKADFRPENVKNANQVLKNISKKDFLLVDARSEGRFNGTAPEPREGLSNGHIPGSTNLPYEFVLNNGKFKPKQELKQLFKKINPENKKMTFSCGSGITACILYLANELVFEDSENSVYDGSWTEWAQLDEYPIQK